MATATAKRRLPRPRGRWVVVVALLAAAAVVVAIVVSNNKPKSNGSGAGTTATGAATVRRRNLVATDTESGTLSYASAQTVYNRLSGTITWVPQVGAVIKPGQPLFDVDNKPVLLMDGSTPAYRNLTASDVKGPDVYELNKNLVKLGYNPDGIVVDDEWQAATTAGIERMQYDHGEKETGKLTLGQVVFLPGPQMIQTVSTTVGSTVADDISGAQQPLFVDYPSDTGSSTDTGTTTTDTGTTTTDTNATSGTGTTDTGTTGTGTSGTGSSGTTGTGTTGPGTTETGADTTTGATTSPGTTTPRTSTTGKGTTTTPKTSTTVSGGDNLSQRTLQALMRLIAEQQRELQAEQHGNHPSSGSPKKSSRNPSRHSGSPAKHSSNPKKNSGNPKKNSGSPKKSSGSPSTDSGSPSHGTGNTGNGGAGGAATAVLTTSSTKLVVTVDLSASSQSEATIGERVGVQMPNGSTVGGRVTAVSPVATSSSGDNGNSGSGNGGSGSGGSTVPVTIELDKRARGGGLDQASVSVNFVQSKARNVLSVPVTALLATSGSSFAVQAAARPHKLIPVTTGLFAAGYVEISGPGIYPGLQVTDSQG